MYKSMPGDRAWWRLAYDADGKLIGFEIPSANAGGPVVGYLGVLPEHRGHRYIDDLLAEITHQLAETGRRAHHGPTPTSATCRWPRASNARDTGTSRSAGCCPSRRAERLPRRARLGAPRGRRQPLRTPMLPDMSESSGGSRERGRHGDA